MKMDVQEIVVDGKTYVPKSEAIEYSGDLAIVILQRGWNMIGKLEKNGSDCTLHNASVIRRWGTSHGLGELAKNGPLPETKLDPCYGEVKFDNLTVVATISCSGESWKNKL